MSPQKVKSTRKTLALWVVLSLGSQISSPGIVVVQPDMILTPGDGGVVTAWDSSFNSLGSFTVPGVGSVTGSIVNPDGNLVMIARSEITDTVQIIESDFTGQIINEYDTGAGSLLRGSYIDFDPGSGRYIFADDDKVTVLDQQLSFLGSTPEVMSRASGVAFWDNGNFYASDQSDDIIFHFNASFELVSQIPYSSRVSVAMDRDAQGNLVIADFGDGEIDLFNPLNSQRTNIVNGLDWGEVSGLLVLPDGNILTASGELKKYSPSGQLLLSGPAVGDSVAYYTIPEPGSISLFVSASLFLGLRRRRCFSAVAKLR